MTLTARDKLFDQEFLARLEQLHLLAKRLAARGSPGQRRSRRLGDGLEFADHRDYAAGDDTRFIDWPYYARMEKLLLRLFHEHSDSDVTLLLDCSGSMGLASKFDYARRVAAALAYVAMGSLDRVTIAPFAADVAQPYQTGRNRGQILAVLDYLAGLLAGGGTQLGECSQRLAARPGGGTVVLLSDLLDCQEELSDSLLRLRQHNDVVVVQVYSPQDAQPTLDGPLVLQQAEDGTELRLEATQEVLAGYRAAFEQFRAACERTSMSRGAIYVSAPTSLPFESLVLQTLRRAGVLD